MDKSLASAHVFSPSHSASCFFVTGFLFAILLLTPLISQAQQFIPHVWQRDSLAYAAAPWVRDANSNRIDDLIEAKSGTIIDIVIDLNRFVPADTLLATYKPFVTSGDSIYIDKFVSFLFVPDVLADNVASSIIKNDEVFMVEYAGKFMSALDTSVPSMAVRPSSAYSPLTLQEQFSNGTGENLTGNGIGVIILDSGVNDNGGHQALVTPMWQYDFSILTSGVPENPSATGPHATVMALTAFGKGTAAGTHKGVALCGTPGVSWGDIKVFAERVQIGQAVQGASRFDHVQAGLNHVITLARTQPIRIVNMSFAQFNVDAMGRPTVPLPDDGTESFSQLVNYAVAQGLVCIASAGNNRSLCGLFPEGCLTTPGAAFGAITVGASKTLNNINRNAHLIADISSKGPLEVGKYRWKPDLAAPGLHVESTPIAGLFLPAQTVGIYQENTIFGSSVAAAHVSGLAALMLEYKNLTPSCLKDALLRSAHLLALYPLNTMARDEANITWNELAGAGFANAYAAFDSLNKADLSIVSMTWQNPPALDVANNVLIKVKNSDTSPNPAKDIHIDLYAGRFGMAHTALSYEKTGYKPTLAPSEETVIPLEYTPVLSLDGVPLAAMRAEIRYGGDMVPDNNSDILSEGILHTSLLTKVEAGRSTKMEISTIDFEIYNADLNPVKVKLKVLSQPVSTTINFKGVPDVSSILVPPVDKPPIRIKTEVTHLPKATGIIRLKTLRTLDDSEYGELVIRLDSLSTSVDAREPAPSTFILEKNFPNPFSMATQIQFVLPFTDHASVEVYNLLGQKVKTLLNQKLPAGKQTALWDGTDDSGKRVAPGIYFYKLRSEKFVQSKKMVLLH